MIRTLVGFVCIVTSLAAGFGYRGKVAGPRAVLAPVAAAQDAQSDYEEALAKWNADVAALAAWEAADATRNAALAAEAQRLADLASAKAPVPTTFFVALDAMQPITWTPTWPGPTGYWWEASGWLNGADDVVLPPSLAGPHGWIRNRITAASLDPTAWDAHVAACVELSDRRAVPPVTIPPDPGPRPPDPGPEPQPPPPPTTAPANYVADPNGFTIVATGARVNDARVLNRLWSTMKPGEIVDLTPGSYPRMDVKGTTAARPIGSAPITFRGVLDANGKRPKILRNVPPSGGSNTLFFGPGAHGARFERLDIEGDDTAAVKTATGTLPNFGFTDCRIFAYFDPVAGTGSTDDSKWALHLYETSGWSLDRCEIFGIAGEHAWYDHNRQGNVTWRDVIVRHCQRTAYQDVSRPGEGKIAKGNVLLERIRITDVCLEDGGGGSAITCRGGNPNSDWTLRDVVVELGSDPALQAPWNKNITGCVVFDNGSGGVYGGTRSVLFERCTFRVGLVHPGVSNARRSNVRLEVVGAVTFRDCEITQGPQAHPIALEIAASVGDVTWLGGSITGRVKYNGIEYQTGAAWLAAKDPDGDGKLAE